MITDEIYGWIARRFSGDAIPEEEEKLNAWLNESEENRTELEALRQVWKAEPVAETIHFDTAAAWDKVSGRLTLAPVVSMKSGFRRWRMVIAASLVLLIGLGFLFRDRFFATEKMVNLVAQTNQVVRLEDGSAIYLRQGASFSYPEHFSANKREVKLKGEAFFDIARDESRPFTISAGDAGIRVLGTSFLVRTSGADSVLVAVRTGRVKLFERGQESRSVELNPGQQGLLGNHQLTKSETADLSYLDWKSGVLRFDQTPMAAALAEITQRYSVWFKTDANLQSLIGNNRLTGQFDYEKPEALFQELEMVTPFRFKKQSDSIYIITSR